MTARWDVLRVELADTRRSTPYARRRKCVNGCGRMTQSTNGICWVCQPSLLDEPEPEPTNEHGVPLRQLTADDPWPEGF